MANTKVTRELISKLGTVPDNELAIEYNVSRERIRQLRVKYGIPKFASTAPMGIMALNKTLRSSNQDDIKHDLETLGTKDLIAKYKIGFKRLCDLRKQYGVVHKWNLELKLGEQKIAEVVAKLGKVSDCQIAKEYNVPPQTINYFRKKLGVKGLETPRWAGRWDKSFGYKHKGA